MSTEKYLSQLLASGESGAEMTVYCDGLIWSGNLLQRFKIELARTKGLIRDHNVLSPENCLNLTCRPAFKLGL
jgi:hypothetical protein